MIIFIIAVSVICFLLGGLATYFSFYNEKGETKRGFTDRMYLYNVAFVTVTVLLSFIAIFCSGVLGITDLSPISVIVPSSFGELAIHTGFVIDKARRENERKFPCIGEENNEC